MPLALVTLGLDGSPTKAVLKTFDAADRMLTLKKMSTALGLKR